MPALKSARWETTSLGYHTLLIRLRPFIGSDKACASDICMTSGNVGSGEEKGPGGV